jgi:hypothetical protein
MDEICQAAPCKLFCPLDLNVQTFFLEMRKIKRIFFRSNKEFFSLNFLRETHAERTYPKGCPCLIISHDILHIVGAELTDIVKYP